MKVTIDTKMDSREELIHVIDMLNKVIGNHNSNTISPKSAQVTTSALGGLFDDQPSSYNSSETSSPMASLFDDPDLKMNSNTSSNSESGIAMSMFDDTSNTSNYDSAPSKTTSEPSSGIMGMFDDAPLPMSESVAEPVARSVVVGAKEDGLSALTNFANMQSTEEDENPETEDDSPPVTVYNR